jgi:secreted trypsin-like serine protease
VGILNKSIARNQSALFCGGTLVKPNYIVTAAHCSEYISPWQVQVLTGTHRLDGTGVRRNVEKIYIHPNYNPLIRDLDYDVAVWKLASSAYGIPLASIAQDDVPVGTRLKTSGWGYLSYGGGEVQQDLRQVNIPRVSRVDCNDEDSYNKTVTYRMFCAGYEDGGKDSCQGDSGGPITRNLGSGYNVLVGVVSWGDECALPEKFGVYTRIASPAIHNFITSIIGP